MTTTEPNYADYRNVILERLHLRDHREQAHHDVISANAQLMRRIVELQNRNDNLNATVDNLTRNAEHGSPATQQRVNELDRRIRELNEERANMYKTQSENAQRLVNLNEQLRIKEETETRQQEEIKQLSESVQKLSVKNDLQTQQLREKDVTIQILQDELAALQLEIVTTEERSKKLQKENEQLLQRWLDLKNQEADKMNEANQFIESIREQAQNAGQTISRVGGKWILRSISGSLPTEEKGTADNQPRSTVILPNKASKKMSVHDGEIYCIKASSTGSMFATGSADKKIKIYDARTGHINHTLSGALQTVTSVEFNSTDEILLGTSTDNATRLWNLSTCRLRHTLTGHIGKVFSAKFTADSTRVVSGSHDRTLKVWDLQRGNCSRTIFTFSSCNDLALVDVDGHTLVSGHLDCNVRLWDTRTGNGIKELTGFHTGQVVSISVSPDGSTVLTSSRDNTLKLIDLRMYDILATFQAPNYRSGSNWSRACFSPDAAYVAAGSADGVLYVWNTRTQMLERELKEHSGVVCGVSWNPFGSYLYTAEKNSTVCMWDTSLKSLK